jgi:UDP-N-acetylmuramate dehydrogenase
VVGNAGAWGGDVASVLRQATILETGGHVAAWPVERLAYGYRSSALKRQAVGESAETGHRIVLAAEFSLQPSDPQRVKARLAELAAKRRASQPPGASCGSVFKNPPGDYAGRLIEAAGLKGHTIGGAQISPVHANFFLNLGRATAADVRALIDLARQSVRDRFGVDLELEIELLGDDR